MIFAGWLPHDGLFGGSVRWSKGRAWQREPLLLIVRSRVSLLALPHPVRHRLVALCGVPPSSGGVLSGGVLSAARPAGRPPGLPVPFAWQGPQWSPGSRAAAGRRAAIAQRPLRDPGPLPAAATPRRRCRARGAVVAPRATGSAPGRRLDHRPSGPPRPSRCGASGRQSGSAAPS